MSTEELLEQVKLAVLEVEPEARILLYGSRARGDAAPDSDWDFLVFLEGKVDDERIDRLRHRLYAIEVETDHLLSSIIMNREEWDLFPCRATPFHERVTREGVRL